MTMTCREIACVVAFTTLAAGTPGFAADDWPGLRGPNQDGSAARGSRFGSGEGAMAVTWRARLGPGYSGVAVSGGRAVTMFSEAGSDFLASFDAASGREEWRMSIGDAHRGLDGSFDGPIATPAIAGARVFALGPRGHLVAADLATGRVAWRADLGQRDGARKPHYGFGTSPIVADGVLVVQTGGEKGRALAGFDPATGERRWTVGDDAVQYQSPVTMTVGGREIVVAAGDVHLRGIDPATGRIVFEHAHGGEDYPSAVGSAVPVPAGDGRVFLKTHSDKSTMFEIRKGPDGTVSVQTLWVAPVLRTTYVIPVYRDGYLYGMTGRTVFTCVDAATGQVKWRSREPGDGFPTRVGDDIAFLTKERTLHVGTATPEGWTERARLEPFTDLVWTAPSVAAGALFARSQGEIVRVDWKAAKSVAEVRAAVRSETLAGFLAQIEAAREPAEKSAAVDRLLSAAPGGPLIEPPDRVVFLYRGEANDVGIATDLIGTRREDPMRRVPGTDLFFYEARLDPDARVSYQFVRNFEPPMPDPRNPRRVPWGASEASSIPMSGWKEPSHLREAPEARRGRLEKVEFASVKRPGTKASMHVYVPVGYDTASERYPAAYVLDGDGARERGLVARSLDNLIPETVAPAIAVFLGRFDWGSTKPRSEDEFAVVAEMMKEVVPFVDARFRTLADPGSRAIVAAGFPAQAALRAIGDAAGLFGAVGLQSPSMLDTDEAAIFPLLRPAAERPLRVYHDWGRYDAHATRERWDMRVTNTRLSALLRDKGHRPVGGEAPDGTGWASWRNRTDRLFATLFPPRR